MNKRAIIGLLLMLVGIIGATREVNTTWHYFGTGILFGVGLTLVLTVFFNKKRELKG